ncbi:hypothetical protein PYW07_005708 [Mythimna separata]|uniref:Uncharacterized protein n=1 Tax=Mythimna separata TaxID=271217 RepID=A0AAD8DQX9_MYTSE|nr:hypothetical protein PYW07_005708 [Mythimna separata]
MDSDSLFVNQTELYEILCKFLTNIKKDGSERKTVDNYKRKAQMLETYRNDYLKNHRKMCELSDFDHVYFKKGCFETAQEVYLNIKENIDKTIELKRRRYNHHQATGLSSSLTRNIVDRKKGRHNHNQVRRLAMKGPHNESIHSTWTEGPAC